MPFVPVTPIITSPEAGSPKKFRLMSARARRLSRTRTKGAPPSGLSSQIMHAAPFSTACGMYLCPSDSKPRTAVKAAPGLTARES